MNAFDTNSVTFLISPQKTKQKLADLVTQWFQQLQEHKDQKGYLPFDCPRQVLCFQFLRKALLDSKPAEADDSHPPWSILKDWLDLSVGDAAHYISECKAKYRSPKEGRKWVWQMQVSAMAPPTFRAHLAVLLTHSDTWQGAGIELLQTKSSTPQLEKQLWKQLKSNP